MYTLYWRFGVQLVFVCIFWLDSRSWSKINYLPLFSKRICKIWELAEMQQRLEQLTKLCGEVMLPRDIPLGMGRVTSMQYYCYSPVSRHFKMFWSRCQQLEKQAAVTSELVGSKLCAMNRVTCHMLSNSQWNSGSHRLILKPLSQGTVFSAKLGKSGSESAKIFMWSMS